MPKTDSLKLQIFILTAQVLRQKVIFFRIFYSSLAYLFLQLFLFFKLVLEFIIFFPELPDFSLQLLILSSKFFDIALACNEKNSIIIRV